MEFFTHIALLASMAVVAVQEILKLNVIPGSFANEHPVPTNIILSIVASIVAVWRAQAVHPVAWTDWLLMVGTIAVVAAIIHNHLTGRSQELRSAQGTGK